MSILSVSIRLDDVTFSSVIPDTFDIDINPYLWTAFFKYDGSTTYIDPQYQLHGAPEVFVPEGAHNDLDTSSIGPGDAAGIPSDLGSWLTSVTPIAEGLVPGSVGFVAVVLIDNGHMTDDSIHAGWEAFRDTLSDQLTTEVGVLNVGHPEPTAEDIARIQSAVSKAAYNATLNAMSTLDQLWVGILTEPDDTVGSQVWFRSTTDLPTPPGPTHDVLDPMASEPVSVPFQWTPNLASFPVTIDLDLHATVTVARPYRPRNRHITCASWPAGESVVGNNYNPGAFQGYNDDDHSPWSFTETELIARIQAGDTVRTDSPDRRDALVMVTTRPPDPPGTVIDHHKQVWLQTMSDSSRVNNLNELPECPT